jgi:hypothetical protein
MHNVHEAARSLAEIDRVRRELHGEGD